MGLIKDLIGIHGLRMFFKNIVFGHDDEHVKAGRSYHSYPDYTADDYINDEYTSHYDDSYDDMEEIDDDLDY